MENQDSRFALLARISSLYYDHNKSQQQISEITSINRSMISRMLTEARENGVVNIVVRYPWTSNRLESALVESFGLKYARVMVKQNETFEENLQGLGILAAEYFQQILRDKMVIGISWGSALHWMIQALKAPQISETEVVQLIGATGSENMLSDGPLLAQQLATCLGSGCRYLHAPLIVENKMIRDSLLQERGIRETLNRAKDADIALVGIGSIHSDLYSLKRAGYLTEAERQQLESSGVAGDICGQHYSIDGHWLDIDINNRVVGADLNILEKINTVIAVAGDERKGDAILGALRGKFVDVLVTDSQVAQYVLDHA